MPCSRFYQAADREGVGNPSWARLATRNFQMEAPAWTSTGPVGQYACYAALGCAVLAVLVSKYVATLIIGAASAYLIMIVRAGGGSQERVLAYILQTSYDECQALLASVDCVGLQDLGTRDNEKLQTSALAVSAGLSAHEKRLLKRCLQTVLDMSTMAELGPRSRGPYEQWVPLYHFLATITTIRVPCGCGCGKSGPMDWLDSHFQDDPHARATVASRLLIDGNDSISLNDVKRPRSASPPRKGALLHRRRRSSDGRRRLSDCLHFRSHTDLEIERSASSDSSEQLRSSHSAPTPRSSGSAGSGTLDSPAVDANVGPPESPLKRAFRVFHRK